MIEFIKNIDWVAVFTVILALFGIARIITGLTPSEKDNEFVAKIGIIIDKIIDAFLPNFKKGGGVHGFNFFDKGIKAIKKK